MTAGDLFAILLDVLCLPVGSPREGKSRRDGLHAWLPLLFWLAFLLATFGLVIRDESTFASPAGLAKAVAWVIGAGLLALPVAALASQKRRSQHPGRRRGRKRLRRTFEA